MFFGHKFNFLSCCFPQRKRRKKMLAEISTELKLFKSDVKSLEDERQRTSLGMMNTLERHFFFTCDDGYEGINVFVPWDKPTVPYGTHDYIRGMDVYIPKSKPQTFWRRLFRPTKKETINVLMRHSGNRYGCKTCKAPTCPYACTNRERDLKSMSRTESWAQDHPVGVIHMGSPDDDEPVRVRRTRIPKKPNHQPHIWQYLKHCIGKDLGRISLPVEFCEPISMLQRMTEDLEYSFILDDAANIVDSLEQLARVGVFAVSCFANISRRTGKPFNPLQFETFEYDRMKDYGWRCIAEQITHHPMTMAFHSEGRKWKYWQEITLSTRFKGTSVTVVPQGTVHLEFHSGNHYLWKKATTTVTGLIIGKMHISPIGIMEIQDPKRFRMAKLEFPSASPSNREITGFVVDEFGSTTWKINGAWDRDLSIRRLEDVKEKVIWKCNNPLPNAQEIYNFSLFTCQLNEMEPGVAPTDSRLRPDQRLLEQGFFDLAADAKYKIEERQRIRLHPALKEEFPSTSSWNIPPKNLPPPLWFKKEIDPYTTESMYVYSGYYWETKDKGDWRRCPTIFEY